jgi:protoporphyrinogen oxidase
MAQKVESVVILGGGLTGLSAAYKLAASGVRVCVLEESPRLGGLAASIRQNGCTFDYGPHRFHTKNRDQLHELQTLLDGELNCLHRKSSIWLMGQYFSYPLDVKELLFKMNPLKSARAFVDYMFTRAAHALLPRPDVSFEDWVVQRFGRTLYDIYFGPYTEKLWGLQPAGISADWASERISLMNLGDVAARLFIRRPAPRTYASRFYYPLNGTGQIAESLAHAVTMQKGIIHTGARVCSVRWNKRRVEAVTYRKEGRDFSEKADYVISTIPVTDLVLMSDPLPEGSVTACARSLQYRGIVFLFLVTKRPELTDNHWIYCPEKKLIFNRLSEPANFGRRLVPAGKTAVCVEISCNRNDSLWQASGEDIFRASVTSLKHMGLLDTADIEDYFTDRLPHAYPIYTIGYEKSISRLLHFLHSSDNLITAGRQGLFRYGNMDHAIDMGFHAARFLLSPDQEKTGLFESVHTKAYLG